MDRSGAGGVQIPIELRACDLRVQKWALTSLNSTPHSIQLAHRLSPPLHTGAEHRRCEAYGPESISSYRPLTLSHRMSRMPEERPTPQVPLAIDYLVVPARLELGVGGAGGSEACVPVFAACVSAFAAGGTDAAWEITWLASWPWSAWMRRVQLWQRVERAPSSPVRVATWPRPERVSRRARQLGRAGSWP